MSAGEAPITPVAKLLAPRPQPPVVRRPRLESLLDDAFGRPLTVVSGGAGFGKSTLLASWVADVEHAWYTVTPEDASPAVLARGLAAAIRRGLPTLSGALPGDLAIAFPPEEQRARGFAAILCESLHDRLAHDVVLVLDDVHHLDQASAATALVESLCLQAPPRLHVVLASRTGAPFAVERLRGRGQVVEVTARSLVFTPGELVEYAAGVGIDDSGAEQLLRLTGGWPAAVRLASSSAMARTGESTAQRSAEAPGEVLYAYLAAEVFADDPGAVCALVRRVAPLDRLSLGLCEALGLDDAEPVLALLVRRGLVTETEDGTLVLHDLVRQFARERWPLSVDELTAVHGTVAAWLEAEGRPAEALDAYAASGDAAAVARLLTDAGGVLVARGDAERVVSLAAALPAAYRTPEIELVECDARATLGDLDRALAILERAAPEVEAMPPAVAWRLLRCLLLRGELRRAVAILDHVDDGGDADDDARVAAWAASAHYRLGEAGEAADWAARALALAEGDVTPAARSVAHAAAAMAAEAAGDHRASELHQGRAIEEAELAGDLVQLGRLRNNRGSLLVEQGRYEEAMRHLDEAVQLAELAGTPSALGISLMNRGLCRYCQGLLDEAFAEYEAAIRVYRALDTGEIAYALIGRADIHRERGELALARRYYEEGLGIAELSGDLQGIVPGLYQQAKVLLDDEPARALEMARRAVEHGWPDPAWALNALGWLLLARDDAEGAGEAAARAEQIARTRGDRFGLAEALELRAMSATDLDRCLLALGEALAVWRDLGNELHVAAVELAIARHSPGVPARAAARRAERTLHRLGARVGSSAAAGLLRALGGSGAAPLGIEALGAFRVRRDGATVPLAEWKSRKARDLLKMLVAHGGRPLPRDVAFERLWPGEDPGEVGNRLSVALSTVRATLDPDKRYPADHYVAAGAGALSLRLEHVWVDVPLFLHDARVGLATLAAGRADEARELLEAAEAAYTGDLLEEDPYEDWTVSPREEARAAYVAVVRALADDARATGDLDRAIGYHLRVLEHDRFDEGAHLGLVSALSTAGRHGEALRRHRIYADAMREIGIEPVPVAAPLDPV